MSQAKLRQERGFFAKIEPHLPIAEWLRVISQIYFPNAHKGGNRPKQNIPLQPSNVFLALNVALQRLKKNKARNAIMCTLANIWKISHPRPSQQILLTPLRILMA
ncbi:MAG: hypothetical protein FWG63_05670 [Defluviitaleaceae bacterium]|nr:hypothetical protein [Defluviitaleaceae bacterium]